MPNRPWLTNCSANFRDASCRDTKFAGLIAELSDHLADMMESHHPSGRTLEAAAVSCLSSDLLQENHMSMEASVAECLGNTKAR